jgi:EmrB/QacA subfamily drug resistance transporter
MDAPTPPAVSSAADRRRWIALVVVCLAMLMNVLDSSIVNVALPSIQRDLHFTQANLTWVVDAYLITYGSFLLMAGRLGDLVGRKRVFLAGLLLFTVASTICGVSQSQGMLIAARFAQGFGAAVASSVIIAIIATEFPNPVERAKAMSVYIFVAVGGGSLGLLAGGVLTQAINWHWIFFVNIPIGIAAFVLGSALIEDSEGLGIDKGVDVLGSVLVTGALMAIIYAIVKVPDQGWGSASTLGFGGAGVALLAAFGVLEARLANPIMPLRILRVRGLLASSAVRAFLASGLWATFFLGALYLEHVRGYSALRTGLAFMPMTLAVAILSSGITARLITRFSPKRVVMPGVLTMGLGMLLLSQAGEHTSYFPTVFVAYLLAGIGAGTSFMPLLQIAMAEVPRADAGLGSGIVNVSMQISAAIGLAVLSTISTDHTRTLVSQGHSAVSALTSGYQLAFVVAAGLAAVGFLVATALLHEPRAEPEAAAATAEAA